MIVFFVLVLLAAALGDPYAYDLDEPEPSLNATRCGAFMPANDRLHIKEATVQPRVLVPGKEMCVSFTAAPDQDLPASGGWVMEFETPAGMLGPLDLCRSAQLECPVKAGATVTGRMCAKVPLETIVLGGSTLDVRAWVLEGDGSGRAVSCIDTRLFVGTTLAVDEADEETHAASHGELRRALQDFAADDAEPRASIVTEDDVRMLLHGLYVRRPEWAGAFEKWREREGKEDPKHYRTMADEALAFDAFRTNVLSASRAGSPLLVDEYSDLKPEARRTLSHFA